MPSSRLRFVPRTELRPPVVGEQLVSQFGTPLVSMQLPASGSQKLVQSSGPLILVRSFPSGSQKAAQSGAPSIVLGGGGGGLTDDGRYIYTHGQVFPESVLIDDCTRPTGWYGKNCDQANASGGLAQTGWWCGNIFSDDLIINQCVVTLPGGLKVFTSGNRSEIGQGNMADKRVKTSSTWMRWSEYVYLVPGYIAGAEKRWTINNGNTGDGGIDYGNLSWNCASSASTTANMTMGIPVPQDECINCNFSFTAGTWVFMEGELRLVAQGSDVFRFWGDYCGTNPNRPVNPVGPPTLRASRSNLRIPRYGGDSFDVSWLEAWANAPSIGTAYRLLPHVRIGGGAIGFDPMFN